MSSMRSSRSSKSKENFDPDDVPVTKTIVMQTPRANLSPSGPGSFEEEPEPEPDIEEEEYWGNNPPLAKVFQNVNLNSRKLWIEKNLYGRCKSYHFLKSKLPPDMKDYVPYNKWELDSSEKEEYNKDKHFCNLVIKNEDKLETLAEKILVFFNSIKENEPTIKKECPGVFPWYEQFKREMDSELEKTSNLIEKIEIFEKYSNQIENLETTHPDLCKKKKKRRGGNLTKKKRRRTKRTKKRYIKK